MNLPYMVLDELKGFYRSKVIQFLWIGMPVIALLLHFYADGIEDMPVSSLTALVVSSLSGTLSSALLVVSIISEKEKHVYDLFVIRPVRRRDIMLSKFIAVYICVALAAIIAIGVGMAIDMTSGDVPLDVVLPDVLDSLLISLGMLAVTGSAGVLIGVLSPSILVGVVLVLYGGNQISGLIGVMGLYLEDKWISTLVAVVASTILLVTAVILFERKQL